MIDLPADLRTSNVLGSLNTVQVVDALQDAGCFDPKVILLHLHRLILRNPDDDQALMLWADWAERDGQSERAEFVRVQCELGSKGIPPYHTPDPECPRRFQKSDRCGSYSTGYGGNWRPIGCVDCWSGLRRRERELLEAKGDEWASNIAILTATDWGAYGTHKDRMERKWRWEWSRGFISSITLSWENFRQHESKLLWWEARKCEKCEGEPLIDRMDRRVRCSACGGTGEIAGATDVCPDCEQGTVWKAEVSTMRTTTLSMGRPCLRCGGVEADKNQLDRQFAKNGRSGTGRIPRPVSLTHQPIEKITLTTWPTPVASIGSDGARHWDGTDDERESSALAFLCTLWPSVREWILPTR